MYSVLCDFIIQPEVVYHNGNKYLSWYLYWQLVFTLQIFKEFLAFKEKDDIEQY